MNELELLLGQVYSGGGSGGGGGGGTTNYNALSNKPKINSVELSGNKTLSDLGMVDPAIIGKLSDLTTAAKNTLVAAINELDGDIGNLATLTTAAKATVVAALNELDSDVGDLETLTTVAKASVVLAINELDKEMGTLSTLTTTAKNTIVAAINELDAEIGSLASLTTSAKGTVVAAINELDGEIGVLTSLKTSVKTTLVAAINAVVDSIGTLSSLKTSAKTDMVSALNELHDNVLEKDNTVAFTPDADYEPATKKYVDDENATQDAEIAAVANVGAKNLLPNDKGTATISGVTFTRNSDGSITTSGTATAAIWYEVGSANTLPKGKYIMSGCPSGGSATAYDLRITADGSTVYSEYGNGLEIPLNADVAAQYHIVVRSGQNMDGKTFYPMLRNAAIKDDTYVPYGMDNAALTKEVVDAKTIAESGGQKNLFSRIGFVRYTANGITFTRNADNSVTINGTATANISANAAYVAYLKKGTYKITGAPAQSTGVFFRLAKGENGETYIASVYGDYTFTVTEEGYYAVGPFVNSGRTVTNMTLYPMIRDAAITDDTYEPYKMSAAEITEELSDTGWLTLMSGLVYRKKNGYVTMLGMFDATNMPTIAAKTWTSINPNNLPPTNCVPTALISAAGMVRKAADTAPIPSIIVQINTGNGLVNVFSSDAINTTNYNVFRFTATYPV